jgi:hypothetical protein
VTRYINGRSENSHENFVKQGDGWASITNGGAKGYFEFVNGRIKSVASPNQDETDKLLDEMERYYKERNNAYRQSEIDSDNDFERLGQLLKENLYSWWD